MSLQKLSLLEIFLLQLLVWLPLWLLNDYMATLLTSIVTPIVFCILLIAAVAELIEPSRVPRRYFLIMGITLLAPLFGAVIYLWVAGAPDWLRSPF